jgi:hypothetical protein
VATSLSGDLFGEFTQVAERGHAPSSSMQKARLGERPRHSGAGQSEEKLFQGRIGVGFDAERGAWPGGKADARFQAVLGAIEYAPPGAADHQFDHGYPFTPGAGHLKEKGAAVRHLLGEQGRVLRKADIIHVGAGNVHSLMGQLC